MGTRLNENLRPSTKRSLPHPQGLTIKRNTFVLFAKRLATTLDSGGTLPRHGDYEQVLFNKSMCTTIQVLIRLSE